MFRRKRGLVMALALVAATVSLPGCLLAVGSHTEGSDRRFEKLEARMRAAEQRLGIATAEVSK
jgi:hypothetical protein